MVNNQLLITAPQPSADVLGCVVLATSSEVAIVDAWNIVGGYINVRDSIQVMNMQERSIPF